MKIISLKRVVVLSFSMALVSCGTGRKVATGFGGTFQKNHSEIYSNSPYTDTPKEILETKPRMENALASIETSVSGDANVSRSLKSRSVNLDHRKNLIRKVQESVNNTKYQQKHSITNGPENGKSQLVALLLCLLIGGLGIHRFYLGYPFIGILQILTLGGLGIWTLIDLVRIIVGDLKPKHGEYTETLSDYTNKPTKPVY